MADNSFLGFSEDGTQLFEMKSKLARQTGDDVSTAIKTTIRATLGVPGSAEGLVPANNLDDVSSVPTSRDNLSVYSQAEINSRQLSKQPANGLRFNAAADKIDGTGLSALIGLKDFDVSWSMAWHSDSGANQYIAEFGTSSADRIVIDSAQRVAFRLGGAIYLVGGTLTVHEEVKHYHLSADRDGNATLYINGVAQATTPSIAAEVAYSMADAGWTVNSSSLSDITLYSVNVFSRNLTAAQILRLAINGNVPEVSDQYAGALDLTSGTLVVGNRYRLTNWITADDFTNVGASSNADGVEFIATGTTPATWSNSSVVTIIGAVLVLLPENIQSNGDWIDASSNELNGVNTSATPLMVKPQTSGTFAPAVKFATGGNLDVTYQASGQQGTWKKVAEKTILVEIRIKLLNVGTDTSNALITGFPFTAKNHTAKATSVPVLARNMTGLVSGVVGEMGVNTTEMNLYDYASTGITNLVNTNFSNTSDLQLSFVYETE